VNQTSIKSGALITWTKGCVCCVVAVAWSMNGGMGWDVM
jgi:hypothetical protein